MSFLTDRFKEGGLSEEHSRRSSKLREVKGNPKNMHNS